MALSDAKHCRRGLEGVWMFFVQWEEAWWGLSCFQGYQAPA